MRVEGAGRSSGVKRTRLIVLVVLWLSSGCARGVGNASPADAVAGVGGGEPVADASIDAGVDAAVDSGQPPDGDPCERGQTAPCECAGDGGAQGVRTCLAAAASPLGGFFSECRGCAAEPPITMACRDGSKNGFETDTDCGGSECEPCELGAACVVSSDCVAGGECAAEQCTEPASVGVGAFSNYDHGAYTYTRAVDLDCAGTTTFDSTATGTFTTTTACSDAEDERPEVTCGVAQLVAGGPSVCILRASSFTLGAGHTLRLIGDKPVILAIDGDAAIAGTINASALGATAGAGGNFSGCSASTGMNGQTDTDIDDGAGGGAGGGFAAPGGKGGAGDRGGPNPEGQGGVASAAATELSIAPLRGGCQGGDGGDGWTQGATGAGGAGGGAVQISARGALIVSGTITAGGGGGGAGTGDEDGGGGGGSGGAILLEHLEMLELTGSLRAHGGSGGGGAGTGSDSGQSGADGSDGPAIGGVGGDAGGASDGGRGGDGGRATDADSSASAGSLGSDGEDEGISGGGGGGGGGAAGVIIIRRAMEMDAGS